MYYSVYQEFLEEHGRRPLLSSGEADSKELQNLRIKVLNKMAAPLKQISEDFYQ